MQFLSFVSPAQDLSNAYDGHHVTILVLLSLTMAILAAFVSLLHTRLMEGAATTLRRHLWHLSGALSMGLGVWAMHFIGMVSFRIDVPIYYSPTITAVSVLPAFFAAWVTLLVLSRGAQSWSSTILGGVMMGSGIGLMHYTGMAAIQTQATMLYLPGMFAVSVVVAVVLAVFALASRQLLTPVIQEPTLRLGVCAVIMGVAVASMHYTAMHATVFIPNGNQLAAMSGASANLLVIITLIVAMFIVVISTVVLLMVHRQRKLERKAEARGVQVKKLTERFQSVARRVPGMVFQLHQDKQGHLSFSYLSDAVSELFDTSVGAAMQDATNVLERVSKPQRENILKSLNASAHDLSLWNYEFAVELGEGAHKWLSATAMPEQEAGGSVSWSGFISDITEKKSTQETIKRLAYYDSLTELPNRRFLIKELAERLAELVVTNKVVMLVSINLDGFKRINDVYGQALGDELLKETAQRLRTLLPADALLSRMTADEFVIFAEFETLLQAQKGGERVAEKSLKALAQPYDLPQLRHQSTASAGVVLAESDHTSGDELLRRADLAAHRAKQEGGNRWYFYSACIEEEISARFAMEADLRKALETSQFELYYQLQANAEGAFFGAEALLRWHHPERGMVSPGDFIPVAEDSGLIVPIGDYVLREACKQVGIWQKSQSTSHFTMSVNVSAKQFYQHNFVENVLSIIGAAGIPTSALKLELTESLVLEDMAAVVSKMQTLRSAGVSFSMDDFGTGYSSLSYLSQLPFDEVKIDQAFIRRASSETYKRDWTIVQAIISITQDLGMDVIAEGVETEAQRARLQASGCTRYQGYLFARPVPASELPL